ncbi:fatty acid desaturase-domain-containing protein [Aspergillus californicus]
MSPVQGTSNTGLDIRDLREAIPKRCFNASYKVSFSYLARDIIITLTLAKLALGYIPTIENWSTRALAWMVYGMIQGLCGVGLFVLGHECGHGAFSPSSHVNNAVGWVLHSALFTPYLTWKALHKQHHLYTNNLQKDYNYIPLRREAFAAKLGIHPTAVDEATADAPIVTLLHIVKHQTFGWLVYLTGNFRFTMNNMGASKAGWSGWRQSLIKATFALHNHWDVWTIVISDIGLALAATALWYLASRVGWLTAVLLYVVPCLWVNHWYIAITYLHHIHPKVPKYEQSAWTFMKGSLGTVDRDFGVIGKFFFHNIVDFHVVHHLFPQIPFYHAEEATKAVAPLLKQRHLEERDMPYLGGLWQAFTDCEWIEPSQDAFWYRKRTRT